MAIAIRAAGSLRGLPRLRAGGWCSAGGAGSGLADWAGRVSSARAVGDARVLLVDGPVASNGPLLVYLADSARSGFALFADHVVMHSVLMVILSRPDADNLLCPPHQARCRSLIR